MTEFAALYLSDNINIRRNADKDCVTRALFIDLRKAFDSVDHICLPNCMLTMLLVPNGNIRFCNYLDNRMQCVQYQNCVSECLPVESGVP